MLLLGSFVGMLCRFVTEVTLPKSTAFSHIKCIDNSGAWYVKAIQKNKNRKARGDIRSIQPGDIVKVVGRTGGSKNRVLEAIITSIPEHHAPALGNGFFTTYDTPTCVLIDKEKNPVGNKIAGLIDQKCLLRWPKLASLMERGG